MRSFRSVALMVGLACLSVGTLAGCAAVNGPADRVDKFVAADQDCTGSWWLGDLRAGTSKDAQNVAQKALADAQVTPSALESATNLLDLSKTDDERRNTSAVDYQSEAYMLAVTLHVKNELEAAGYPDADRVMEVWSERSCS